MKNPFGSLITAMITPFDGNLKVDYDKVSEIALFLLDKASEGLVVSGTTGESPSLTAEEKINIFRTVVEAVGGKIKVIAGTGGNSTREALEMSCRAEETGVDGLMLVTPYYNKPPQEGLYRHFKSVAEAVSLPVMLYNVPGRTGVNMTAETCLRLAEIDNIVAVKEASGNIEQITHICAGAPPGFAVYSGDDIMTLPILSVGGVGVVSIASHLAGPKIKEMIDAFFTGKVDDAVKIHQFLAPLFNALFMTTNPVPLKEALRLMEIDSGNLRLPLSSLPPEMSKNLAALLVKYGLLT
ncbi:MAG: 4-hydroxy-tetrahydrodipicolinate synthase [Bacillota bacterium]